MKFAYKFNNLLGAVFRRGNLLFTPDGYSVISPVGNRITIFDLKNNKSNSLCIESQYNYTAIDLSPNGCLLVVVNEIGEAQMISMISQTTIHRYKFRGEVKHLRFSPDGRFFAACVNTAVLVFVTPGESSGSYGSFVVHRAFEVGFDETVYLNWAPNSRVLAIGSRDNTVRLQNVTWLQTFRAFVLGGHREAIVGCFFEEKTLDVNTISKEGLLMLWECGMGLEDLDKTREELAGETDESTGKKKRVIGNDSDDEEVPDTFTNDKDLEGEDVGDQLERLKDAASSKGGEERDEQGKLIAQAKLHPFYYKRLARHYLADLPRAENRNAYVTAATYHQKLRILVVAFSTGSFYLYELPDVNLIHSLSISDASIGSVAFNDTGDWLALGVSSLGQLLVWEWQSEQYIMKQQEHSQGMNCLAYAPDGHQLVTGGQDGKVKLWNVVSGFCVVTFSEHTAAVLAVEFSRNKKFLVSASLDGTVRAYDVIRYRNFRTFTSPEPVQFASVAIDSSGELVAAGGQDVFEIYLWSMKLGRLLEVLSGHEGPVVSLAFSPLAASSAMVSGSWDQTLSIWNCLESSGAHETVQVGSDVVCVAFKPDGEEVAISTLNGNITVFYVKTAAQLASIEGRKDMEGSISKSDIVTAKKNLMGRAFTSICYSADGECLLAGGKSKYVCIYNVKEAILLKKFQITQNRSLDGMDEYINRRKLTEFGNMALIEEREALEGGSVALKLPGVTKGDLAARNVLPEVKVDCVRFSPSGQSWSAVSTEGLLVYALHKGIVFDPYQLSTEVTPRATRNLLHKEHNYGGALLMALKLNETPLIQEVLESVPYRDIELVIGSLPDEYALRTLQFVAKNVGTSQHIEFYLRWSNVLLTRLGQVDTLLDAQTLVTLHQNLNRKYEQLNKMCDFNKYTLQVLKTLSNANTSSKKAPKNGDQNGKQDDSEEDEDTVADGRNGDASSDDEDENEWMLIKQRAGLAKSKATGSDEESDESMDDEN
ncbi:periodic tryptophan protein 2 homolog [Anopheles moucheti]|uniref:periodic tryptophan protein 2 homolog n=1 Tax=Anopheles moucheti TaxID=186751 RepID=UPI0022EFFDE4|nr:periodic tryptophan protein 2 homolog [Anopheles moucheti]XP_052888615.1 periodic tryptophan protein 2 homolog [Anopheles moucheti]